MDHFLELCFILAIFYNLLTYIEHKFKFQKDMMCINYNMEKSLQNETDSSLSDINNENSYFIVCSFGHKSLNHSGRIETYLKTLSISIPGANSVICVSQFTIIDPVYFKYNLKIHIERFGNVTVESMSRKYKNFLDFFSASRYIFYEKYIHSHPEVKYIFFSDDDSLILKNPFELLKKDPEKVHLMQDPLPFSVYGDCNAFWLRSWNSVSKSKKKSCGMNILNQSLRSASINKAFPWNSGLMMGKSQNLLPICSLIAKFLSCVGMFSYNSEQGLLNYIRFAGHLDKFLSNIQTHTYKTGKFISCPDYIPFQNFSTKIKNGEIYVVHHYQYLPKEYINAYDNKIKQILIK